MTVSWSGSPKTWASGAVTSAEFNTELRDRHDWLKAALLLHGIDSATTMASLKSALASVQAVRAASQTISAGVNFHIAFNEADTWDSHAFHNPASNPERITIPAGMGGLYLVTAQTLWNSGSAPVYGRLRVQKNTVVPSDTPFIAGLRAEFNHTSGGGAHYLQVAGVASLVAADYIVCSAFASDTGAAISFTDSYFTATRLSAT